MKIAFLISAHTDAKQLHRLVDALPDGSQKYIHIDAKSNIQQFEQELATAQGVHFLKHRVNVVWGSFNEVEYQMELIREALSCTPDYLITISGMDYPVWSKQRITDYLSSLNHRNILMGIRMMPDDRATRLYQEFRFMNTRPWKNGGAGSKLRVAIRKIIAVMGIKKPLYVACDGKRYDMYKGAAWWAITPEVATEVLKQWDNNKVLKRYFSTSFCPAETFVQTVAFNSEYKDKCMLVEGKYTTLAALTPMTFIDYNPTIKLLDETDYDRIVESGKMFCRKIVSGTSDKLVEMFNER